MNELLPVMEHPGNSNAVLNAAAFFPAGRFAEHAVLCFFKEVLEKLELVGQLQRIGTINLENGVQPIYILRHETKDVLVMHPGVGAPYAAAMLEGMISMGARHVVACGGAGVLNREIAIGQLVIPEVAVRDEGTSYKYVPAAAEIRLNCRAIAAIAQALQRSHVSYVTGKTWTTDAIFRETPEIIARRAAQGCITAEMECAAFAAVSEFRGIEFGQILYGGDDVSSEDWDGRGWQEQSTTREKLFWLAVAAVCNL